MIFGVVSLNSIFSIFYSNRIHGSPRFDAAIASAIADAGVNDQPAVESTAPKAARNNVSQRPDVGEKVAATKPLATDDVDALMYCTVRVSHNVCLRTTD